MKIKEVLSEELKAIRPSEEIYRKIKNSSKNFVDELKGKIKKQKIKAEVFIGGSVAKDTLIAKDKYDVDVFVRFSSSYGGEISDLLAKLVPKAKRVHGSRDYFSSTEENITFEIIPTIKIDNPKNAKNITDLSYFHVNYVKKAMAKNKSLADEIRLAKAFAFYQGCYGAESYINGFSGYALELLIIHYKSFQAFIKAMIGVNKQMIIDPAKHFLGKKVFTSLNESKLKSPIVLIDPTYKERNALAALSDETFKIFQGSCKKFLGNPSKDFFKIKDKNLLYPDAIKLEVFTNKQAGDIAGTKLKKFYRFFIVDMEKFFDIKKSDFVYFEKENKGIIYLIAKPKKELIISGPEIKMKEALSKFKKAHKGKRIIIVRGRVCVKVFGYNSFDGYMLDFKSKKKKDIKEMSINK